jgi:hypothetical protein
LAPIGTFVQQCPAPGDELALLDLTASVMTEPLSRAHPPWAAVVVPGLAGGELAVVLVLKHVLADGLGGLAIASRCHERADDRRLRMTPGGRAVGLCRTGQIRDTLGVAGADLEGASDSSIDGGEGDVS